MRIDQDSRSGKWACSLASESTLKQIPGQEGGLAPARSLMHNDEDSRSGRWACPRLWSDAQRRRFQVRKGGLPPARGWMHNDEDSRSGRWACPPLASVAHGRRFQVGKVGLPPPRRQKTVSAGRIAMDQLSHGREDTTNPGRGGKPTFPTWNLRPCAFGCERGQAHLPDLESSSLCIRPQAGQAHLPDLESSSLCTRTSGTTPPSRPGIFVVVHPPASGGHLPGP